MLGEVVVVSLHLLIEIALQWPLFLGVVKLLTCHGFMPLLHKERWRTNVDLFHLPLCILLLVAEKLCFFKKKKTKKYAHRIFLSEINCIS